MIRHAQSEVKPRHVVRWQFRMDPAALRGKGVVSDPAVTLFAVILDRAKRRSDWTCRDTNGYLAKAMGRRESTVSRLLPELEAAGLIVRELAAGGRIRLAIRVTWGPAVEHLGTSRVNSSQVPAKGVPNSLGTSQALSGDREENQKAPASPGDGAGRHATDEDAASRVAEGPEAAAYLRALIAAGREGKAAPMIPGASQRETPGTPETRQDAPPTPAVRSVEPRAERPATGRVRRVAAVDPLAGVSPLAAILPRLFDDRFPTSPRPSPAPASRGPETTTARPPRTGNGPHDRSNRPGSPGRGPENLS